MKAVITDRHLNLHVISVIVLNRFRVMQLILNKDSLYVHLIIETLNRVLQCHDDTIGACPHLQEHPGLLYANPMTSV